MTAAEDLNRLRDFAPTAQVLEVAVAARAEEAGHPPDARVLALADDAEGFFRRVVQDSVLANIRTSDDASNPENLRGWALRELDPVYKPEAHEVEWAPVDDVEAIALARDRYANLSPLAPFDPDDDAYKKRLAYSIIVLTGPAGERAYFFRSFSSSAELQRKRGAAIVLRQGSFRTVQEHVFMFDEAVDCFVFGDHLYVIRKHDFRRIFEQLEVVRRRAVEAAGDLRQQVPIANFDEFADACGKQALMADKMVAIRGRDYFSQLSISMLEPVIAEFDLDIPVQDVSGERHLVFQKDVQHRFRILKLIDDDYLRSSMTDHRYEVNSKTEPPSSSP